MPEQTDSGTMEHTDSETIDDVLGALENARRRYVMYYARGREQVTVDELASAVAGGLPSSDVGGGAGRRDEQRVRTALYHRDLPKLSAAGLLSVDDRTVTVEPSPLCEAILDVLRERESLHGTAVADDDADRGV